MGATGHDGFKDFFLDEKLNVVPNACKIILPTAPFRQVTSFGGLENGLKITSWYDIKTKERLPTWS